MNKTVKVTSRSALGSALGPIRNSVRQDNIIQNLSYASCSGKISNGLSLVELLVVISVIALLIGLVLPALSRARSIAKQTVCQSKLRQWGLAFDIYAGQNDGFYPHIDGRDRTPSNPQTDADRADYYFGWVDVLPPLMGERPWR